eukprot:TRINITY_DN9080_c0_g3_i1.p1 TRINITY_DN9080_c0_g3~~TRINITY_DN9080_c0_g3_i1.p1  ORF type:complete len:416 (-),score=94.65 TRINITY_DN9080_c0_g3_i1:17-1243(-)
MATAAVRSPQRSRSPRREQDAAVQNSSSAPSPAATEGSAGAALPPPPPPEAAGSCDEGREMPRLPTAPLPSKTRVVVTVPVKLPASCTATIKAIRDKLVLAGFCVGPEHGSFHCRGNPEVLDESMAVGDLQDNRLIFFPERDLEPWQLCAAHRLCEQQARAQFLGGGQSWAEAASRHPLYKTRLCNNWVQHGGACMRGARCVYAHGHMELRRPGQQGAVRPGLQVGALPPRPPGPLGPGLRPPPPPGSPPIPRPPKVPEVVFTVTTEEEKRRAERAKRFAPRVASFEAEEQESKAAKPSSPAEDAAEVPQGEVPDDAEQEAPTDPADLLSHGAWGEEQIADYLMEMQQQFLGSMGAESEGGFGFLDDDGGNGGDDAAPSQASEPPSAEAAAEQVEPSGSLGEEEAANA